MEEKKSEEDVMNQILPQIKFKAAATVLTVMMDEYTKERERSGIIDNKAVALITILVALITIYMPIIPLEKVKLIYLTGNKNQLIFMTISISSLVMTLMISIITFINLIKVINLKTFLRVDIEALVEDDALEVDPDEAEKALCCHYNSLILENSGINDKKAKDISNCFTLIIIVFLLLLFTTVALIMC